MTWNSVWFALGGGIGGFIGNITWHAIRYWLNRRPAKHYHEWSRWRDTELEVTRVGWPAGGVKVGDDRCGQTRVCTTCGLRQIRETGAPL